MKTRTLNIIVISLWILFIVPTVTYMSTPVKEVCIDVNDIEKNYAFDGRVVLTNGETYNIGTKRCAQFWTGEISHTRHFYVWLK